jgi:hypothetical protein
MPYFWMNRSEHLKESHCFHLEAQAVQEELIFVITKLKTQEHKHIKI